jgi:hypothetical protein
MLAAMPRHMVDIGLDELHQSKIDSPRSPPPGELMWRDVLVGVLAFEKQQLRNHDLRSDH